ncbi:hypothetical protein SKAU_G00408270 [Synaphobranchus kaupii]|uniref:YqaJ viral recombinase domain-containing protein n=1 Tax=Synaphobranchus kaupii TaxID=118154 RepID=A0A9Q1IB23_SYNKA|nr:hypothetical protein SKAU_G00408270 [Synaphobranchus kaupii]
MLQLDSLQHLFLDNLVASHDTEDRVLEAMQLSEEQVMAVQAGTVGQRDNACWKMMRKGRLTASKFGELLLAKHVTRSFIDGVLEQPPLDGVQAVQWGIENEREGIRAFQEATGMHVRESGLWLTSSGILGASPDGLVGSNDLIEVKCPYRERDKTIREAVSNRMFCLEVEEDGETYRLKRTHFYWHQVQGQLHVAEKTTCYFVVWTLKDFVIIPISRDESWKPNLHVLESFFKELMLPKLLEEL